MLPKKYQNARFQFTTRVISIFLNIEDNKVVIDKIIAHIILEINHEKIRLILIRKTPKIGGGGELGF